MNAKLFYDVRKPSAFSTLAKLQAAIERQAEGKSVPLPKTRAGWKAKTRTHYISLLENIFPEIPMSSLM